MRSSLVVETPQLLDLGLLIVARHERLSDRDRFLDRLDLADPGIRIFRGDVFHAGAEDLDRDPHIPLRDVVLGHRRADVRPMR